LNNVYGDIKMKKFLLSIIVCVTVLIVGNNNSVSQEGCTAPCTWSSLCSTMVHIDPSCDFLVYYKWCIYDGDEFYFEIIGFGQLSTYCVGEDVYDLIEAAERAILQEPWISQYYPDEEDECLYDVSGFTASCWYWENEISPNNPNYLNVCDASSCCEYQWQICYQEGVYNIYLVGVNIGEPCQPLPDSCFVICPEI
jgi:hypothetical protein